MNKHELSDSTTTVCFMKRSKLCNVSIYPASYADDEDTFECSHGDDLDDLADLDLGTRSHSECEDEKIELDQQEMDDLPGLVVSV